ncbi:MFS transporter [Orrella daihaiensis]|uniref:MFS transporter n=1 Tax=Orrella daihaiensis TaxID=2782176 RepID=A0ABY4ALI8_9BURK|nr:MFS transporter [Orrella daihaiensis]UOD50918.1 MFS transporter [Orrella daihaiensis]
MNQPKNNKRMLLAGVAGNLLEWFDFAVYGFFAVTIGKIFFPAEDPVAQVIAAFGVFAVGFLMRPIGGILLGHIGDKYGRHTAMLISVIAMAVPTFLIGLLPGYATLGLAAPILLLLLRMIQGLSVGGEFTTSIVYMVERANPKHHGTVGALAAMGAVGGMLLGSGFGAVLAASLTEAQLTDWGWRVPFLVGLLLGLAGLYLRRERSTPSFPHEARNRSPLKEALKHHRGVMARVAGIAMINAVVFYLAFVYLVSWLETVDGIPAETALEINTVSLMALLPVMLFGGWLSDRVGGKRVMALAAALLACLAWPLLWLMHHHSLAMVYVGQLGFSLFAGLYLGAQPAFMVKVIPPAVRCTGTGLAYNVTLGVAGGLSPMVATWLVNRTHDDFSPAYMIIVATVLALIAVLSVRESSNTGQQDHLRRARELLQAVDRGGTPSNARIINEIAREFGLEVSSKAPMQETIERIRQAVERAS